MSDLISRSAAIKIAMLYCPDDDGSCSKANIDIREMLDDLENLPAVDAEPVRHRRWILKVHDKRVNYLWTVTAYCSECCDEEKEIWSGYFPGVPDFMAHDVSLDRAKTVKLSNYCPNCGCKMDAEVSE